MSNLFRQVAADQGSLTAALIALLEHGGEPVLSGLMRLAGLPQPAAEPQFAVVPHDDQPPVGQITLLDRRITLVTQAPGEPPPPQDLAGDEAVVITPSGHGPSGAHALSWEQFDRWLGQVADAYDLDTRTGFLVRQFREYLSAAGIEYFGEFDSDVLAEAPSALTRLRSFIEATDQFLAFLSRALSASRDGVQLLRSSRAEDLLTGYCYGDHSLAADGGPDFIRVAFHLPSQELQVSVWLVPIPGQGVTAHNSGAKHAQLRQRLVTDEELVDRLRNLHPPLLLWLWATEGEERIWAEEISPTQIESLEWDRYQIGLQRSLPLGDLAGPDPVGRTLRLLSELLDALGPVLDAVVH